MCVYLYVCIHNYSLQLNFAAPAWRHQHRRTRHSYIQHICVYVNMYVFVQICIYIYTFTAVQFRAATAWLHRHPQMRCSIYVIHMCI